MTISEVPGIQLFGAAIVFMILLLLMFQLGKRWERKNRVLKAGSGDAASGTSRKKYCLVIEIIDPEGVARRESSLARLIVDVAPTLITREVYKKVRKEMTTILKQRNIDVQIQILPLQGDS